MTNTKPKQGSYYTGKDIEAQILPVPKPSPLPKPREQPENTPEKRQFKPRPGYAASTNSLNRPSHQQLNSTNNGDNGAGNKDRYANLHPFLRPFLSATVKRAEGNPASIWTVKLTTEKGGAVSQKFQDFHVIICWYSFLIGAIGGVAVGMETSFFSTRRLPPPRVPIPHRLQLITKLVQFGVRNSSSAYRFSKRALISGYFFDVIDKNVEEYRDTKDWQNMAIAGCITGAFFGLRGGLHGTFFGSLIFGGFAGLSGFYYYYKKGPKKQDR